MLKDIQKRGGTIRQKVTLVEMVEMEESLPSALKANQIKDLQGRNMALNTSWAFGAIFMKKF